MRLSCCQIRTNQTDASQNHMNHYCWLQQRCYRMVQCLFLCNLKKKSKRENEEKCTYKTQLSAEFGPPYLFTICRCRRELAHSCMDNRQLQGCINATLKNDRHRSISRYLMNPEENNGFRARILIADDHPHLIVAAKIVIAIKIQ